MLWWLLAAYQGSWDMRLDTVVARGISLGVAHDGACGPMLSRHITAPGDSQVGVM